MNNPFQPRNAHSSSPPRGLAPSSEGAVKTNLILANSTVTLRYDTIGYRWHSGAYAQIVSASEVAPYAVTIDGPDFLCVGDTGTLSASGAGGGPYTWEITGDAIDFDPSTGVVTAIAPGIATVTAIASGVGHCLGSKEIVVVRAEFKQSSPCSGFDDTQDIPWMMVPMGGNNTALAEIAPEEAVNQVCFSSLGNMTAIVSPTRAVATPESVVVSGVASGSTMIRADLESGGLCALLGIDVKPRLEKTIAIHAISEDNDDVQVIPVGQGLPNQVCITPGTNDVLDTLPDGDDMVVGKNITTGADGICNTVAAATDQQLIAYGNCQPGAVCVAKGANNFRDTVPAGDDVASGSSILVGNDGICNTTANATPLVPTDVPTAAVLQEYLNSITWGKQANVFFTVVRADYSVNYDWTRDGKLADPYELSETWVEIETITAMGKNSNVDFNIYYVKNYEVPVALSDDRRGEAWVGDEHDGTSLYATAHEIGHLLGRRGHTDAVTGRDLMGADDSATSPCHVLRVDWNAVNP